MRFGRSVLAAGASLTVLLACSGVPTEEPVAEPAPAVPAPSDDPMQFVGKWFYEKGTVDQACREIGDDPMMTISTEFRGPGEIVSHDTAGNADQVLHVTGSEKRGDDWILSVRGDDGYVGQRLLRWTRFGEEMQFGMPEDGGVPYSRLDRAAEAVEQGDCGLGTPARPRGKAGKRRQ